MADPLGKQDLESINANLSQLLIADEEIRRATAAGIDVSDLADTARAQRAQLLKLKQTYFPGE